MTQNVNPSILVVDDEPDINLLLARTLQTKGYRVNAYTDPIAALANFKAGQHDLAIVDFKMRAMNGFQLYERLLGIDRSMKFLFLSADSEHYAEYINQFPATESRRYMHKPVHINQLLGQVEDILKPAEKRFKELEYASINSAELRVALNRALSVLGTSVKESMMEEMEREGIMLDGKVSYSLPQIERALQRIFGNDTSSLLMTRIINELRK